MRVRVWGLGCRVYGLGFKVEGLELKVEGLGFRFYSVWFMVQDLGVRDLGLMVTKEASSVTMRWP